MADEIVAVVPEQAGADVAEFRRRLGITGTTLVQRKRQYRHLHMGDAKRLRALENESRRLRRLVAHQALNLKVRRYALGRGC